MVIISDIAVDVFPEALKGVDAVIHTAAPIPDKAEPEVILKVFLIHHNPIISNLTVHFRVRKKEQSMLSARPRKLG